MDAQPSAYGKPPQTNGINKEKADIREDIGLAFNGWRRVARRQILSFAGLIRCTAN